MVHSAATGLMVHGLYLGGVFVAIENGVSVGLSRADRQLGSRC